MKDEGSYHPLVEHFNGTRWKFVPLEPVEPDAGHYLRAIVGSPGDLWTLGYIDDYASGTSLAEHYDGTSWSHAGTPSDPVSHLLGASVDNSHDVWAVGSTSPAAYRPVHAFTIHWDGTAWQQVDAPDLDGHDTTLNAVSAIASDDAWAVGSAQGAHKQLPVIEHWDGKCWSMAAP